SPPQISTLGQQRNTSGQHADAQRRRRRRSGHRALSMISDIATSNEARRSLPLSEPPPGGPARGHSGHAPATAVLPRFSTDGQGEVTMDSSSVSLSGFLSSSSALEVELLLASFVLCSLIGFERQFRQKAAGYRTHVLVGIGTCAFTLVSAYGFAGVLDSDIRLDPSRIAAQIVS